MLRENTKDAAFIAKNGKGKWKIRSYDKLIAEKSCRVLPADCAAIAASASCLELNKLLVL